MRCVVPLAVARPVITLTTDFGLQDAYVGIMKGVMLSIAPEAEIVDLSHEVPPQSIEAGAYLLETAIDYFPAGTVHLAVVDPGVGTERLPIAVSAGRATFVGPDNGLLYPAVERLGATSSRDGTLGSAVAVLLANPEYQLTRVSRTFHGRDIFAPAAAHIALGLPLDRLGPSLTTISTLSEAAIHDTDGAVVGTVIHVDRFGNSISNIRAEQVPANPTVEAGSLQIIGLAQSYQDAEVVALINSGGRLEIAARNGSAAARLHLVLGSPIVVRASR